MRLLPLGLRKRLWGSPVSPLADATSLLQDPLLRSPPFCSFSPLCFPDFEAHLSIDFSAGWVQGSHMAAGKALDVQITKCLNQQARSRAAPIPPFSKGGGRLTS